MAPQSPGVGIAHVVDPSADGCVQFRVGDASGFVEVQVPAQPSGELDGVAALQPSEVRIDDESEPGDSVSRGDDLRLRLVNAGLSLCGQLTGLKARNDHRPIGQSAPPTPAMSFRGSRDLDAPPTPTTRNPAPTIVAERETSRRARRVIGSHGTCWQGAHACAGSVEIGGAAQCPWRVTRPQAEAKSYTSHEFARRAGTVETQTARRRRAASTSRSCAPENSESSGACFCGSSSAYAGDTGRPVLNDSSAASVTRMAFTPSS